MPAADLDCYDQLNPAPPEEEPEPESFDADEDPFEVPLIATSNTEVSSD
jgi:hypothetical protein